MTKRPSPKPYILGIHPYVPGKATASDGRALIKLSANENPLGSPQAALDVLAQTRDPAIGAAAYPDPDAAELRRAIGGLHGIDPARIVCGTGSGELLQAAVQAFAGIGDEIVFSRYSFSLYPLLAHKVGAAPVFADDEGLSASVDALLAAVTPHTKVVLVDNPNNPIGTWLDQSEIARLHAALPRDVLLIVDQAYAEYLDPDKDDGGLPLAAAHENVLVTRTFSKAYGLAAERIGWATGSLHIIDMLNRIRGPFNVTLSGQKAAIAALSDLDFVARSRAHNTAERDRFTAAIAALGNHGLRAIPSEANFVLVVFEGDISAETALAALAEAGYAVRHLPGQGLPHALRITIGKSEDMDRVTAVLRKLCGVAP